MASKLLLRAGITLLLIGMLAGIGMAITQDFRLAPAHAHLNLIGGVLLLLSGLYYHVFPGAAASKLAKVHASVATFGAVFFPIGIAAVLLGGPERYEILAVAGALIVLAGMLIFAWIIYTNESVVRP